MNIVLSGEAAEAVNEAIDLLSAAHMIATRAGRDTNWSGFVKASWNASPSSTATAIRPGPIERTRAMNMGTSPYREREAGASSHAQRYSPALVGGQPDMELDPCGEWVWYTEHRGMVEVMEGIVCAQRWTSRIAFACGAGIGAAFTSIALWAAYVHY